MKVLALDAHISIVADVANIFNALGHEVETHTLSNHAWVLGSETTDMKGIRPRTRLSRILRNDWLSIDQAMCDRFYRKNKERLADVDVFVHSYPPAFAMLFEKFDKPIVTIACTRFDYPCLQPDRLDWLKGGLRRIASHGQLIPVANNRLDQEMCERYVPLGWRHIPSLCNYLAEPYEGSRSQSLLWSRGTPCIEARVRQSNYIDEGFDITRRYDRNEIKRARSVVHIPYQVSIMSAFEHYAQGIPMHAPTPDLLSDWLANGEGVLSEALFPGSSLALPDRYWELSDFYDEMNFAGVLQFDSLERLSQDLEQTDFVSVSNSMLQHHKERTQKVTEEWKIILEGLS